jgi:hypothetical protein
MKKTHPAEEQIALALRQEEAGEALADTLRRLGVSLISLPQDGP